MATLSKRWGNLAGEMKYRLGYSLISAVTVGIILLLIRNSDMPSADEQVSVAVVAGYCMAAIATTCVADVISYLAFGFTIRRACAWQGLLNFLLSTAMMSMAFAYIDGLTPGGIIVIDRLDSNSVAQLWIANCLLALIAVTVTTSFVRSSVKHREISRIEDRCADINSCIARRNSAKAPGQGPIIMDQIINIETDDRHHTSEIAVCDMVYARRIDNRHVSLAYCFGSKTCHMKIVHDNGIASLQLAFANYSQVMRCHNNYLINIDRVTHAVRNGNHYELQLRGTRHLIPVSSKHQDEIYKALTAE